MEFNPVCGALVAIQQLFIDLICLQGGRPAATHLLSVISGSFEKNRNLY